MITGIVTAAIGSYFVYTTILAEKPQNYYELLGVPARGVTKSELKKAFRAASIKYHPDKNPDDDTTDLFIQVKEANDIIGDEQMRFAYDVYSQTNWDQEDTIRKGLKYSKKMTEEEADKLFWHIINNKRMFQSGLEIFPYYFAWVMAVILLVNRSYGRPFLGAAVAMIGAFEFGAKIYYGDPRFDVFINVGLELLPVNYTLGEALKVLRYGMPLILQLGILMMDNSFDVVEDKADDPTALLTKIVERQDLIIKEANELLSYSQDSKMDKGERREKLEALYASL